MEGTRLISNKQYRVKLIISDSINIKLIKKNLDEEYMRGSLKYCVYSVQWSEASQMFKLLIQIFINFVVFLRLCYNGKCTNND